MKILLNGKVILENDWTKLYKRLIEENIKFAICFKRNKIKIFIEKNSISSHMLEFVLVGSLYFSYAGYSDNAEQIYRLKDEDDILFVNDDPNAKRCAVSIYEGKIIINNIAV